MPEGRRLLAEAAAFVVPHAASPGVSGVGLGSEREQPGRRLETTVHDRRVGSTVNGFSMTLGTGSGPEGTGIFVVRPLEVITGAVVIAGLLFGAQTALILSPLVLLVAAARLHLKRHTVGQVAAGIAVGVSVPLIYWCIVPH